MKNSLKYAIFIAGLMAFKPALSMEDPINRDLETLDFSLQLSPDHEKILEELTFAVRVSEIREQINRKKQGISEHENAIAETIEQARNTKNIQPQLIALEALGKLCSNKKSTPQLKETIVESLEDIATSEEHYTQVRVHAYVALADLFSTLHGTKTPTLMDSFTQAKNFIVKGFDLVENVPNTARIKVYLKEVIKVIYSKWNNIKLKPRMMKSIHKKEFLKLLVELSKYYNLLND